MNMATEQCQYRSHFSNNFNIIKLLGRGGFGIVAKAKCKNVNIDYAIKRIPLKNSDEEKTMREAIALAKLTHPNIVRYYTAWKEFHPPGWKDDFDRSFELSR